MDVTSLADVRHLLAAKLDQKSKAFWRNCRFQWIREISSWRKCPYLRVLVFNASGTDDSWGIAQRRGTKSECPAIVYCQTTPRTAATHDVTNSGSTLCQRLRRWPNVEPVFVLHVDAARHGRSASSVEPVHSYIVAPHQQTSNYRWFNVGPTS